MSRLPRDWNDLPPEMHEEAPEGTATIVQRVLGALTKPKDADPAMLSKLDRIAKGNEKMSRAPTRLQWTFFTQDATALSPATDVQVPGADITHYVSYITVSASLPAAQRLDVWLGGLPNASGNFRTTALFFVAFSAEAGVARNTERHINFSPPLRVPTGIPVRVETVSSGGGLLARMSMGGYSDHGG